MWRLLLYGNPQAALAGILRVLARRAQKSWFHPEAINLLIYNILTPKTAKKCKPCKP
jgi:hypothetical protein